MINLKAILIGFFTVIILGLTFQLIFILLDVGYNSLMDTYPSIKNYKQIFYYIIGLPGFFLIMATAGYLTAYYARKNIFTHAVLVGASSCGLALYTSINEDQLTLVGIVFFAVGILFTTLGSIYWKKNNSFSN